MTHEQFIEHYTVLRKNMTSILGHRQRVYGRDNPIHNFEAGAQITGNTPAQMAFSYMAKHFVALRDKVANNDFTDEKDLLEKCTDIINYITFIYAIGMEENKKVRQRGSEANAQVERPKIPDITL